MHRLEFNARSVAGLYAEALLLQREARHLFAEAGGLSPALVAHHQAQTFERIEGAVRWLRDQQAHFEGTVSLFWLRLTCRMPAAAMLAGPDELALLPDDLAELVTAIARFHARLHAIEREWRSRERPFADVLARLRSWFPG